VSATVCITYHQEEPEILERAFWSVQAQSVKPAEIIVVDDGSAPPLAKPWQWDGLSVPARVVCITNRGLPAARNTGLMLAKTEAIVFLDADDWLDLTYIEKTLPLVRNGADVVLTGLQEHGPHRNGRYNPGFDRPWREVTVDLLINDYNRFYYAALWRTEALREMGGYHPAMAGWPGVAGGFEDWTTWIDAMRRGLVFDAVDEPLLNYNTATPNSMLQRAERNRDALVAEMRRHHRLDNPAPTP
jgi:glycosyltransferase involved in cell wall biosynthesis